MKPRIQFFIAIGLFTLILGITWFRFSTHNQEPTQTFPATISRDCAPWDGSAFRVSVPVNGGAMLDISIWQAPDIKNPVTFSFPDNTGRVGNANYRLASGTYGQLSGTVFFWRVEEGNQVEGKFKLVTETGQQFEGQFKAKWKSQLILCG